MAKKYNIKIIPVLTKLDLPHSDPFKSIEQMKNTFNMKENDILWTSAKNGEGIDELLDELIYRVDPPLKNFNKNNLNNYNIGIVIDSYYDQYKGAVIICSILNGEFKNKDNIILSSSLDKKFEINEVGILTPTRITQKLIKKGNIGYIMANIKNIEDIKIGSEICVINKDIDKPIFINSNNYEDDNTNSKVYTSIYPTDDSDFIELKKNIEKLALTDSSVNIQVENSGILGMGYRAGMFNYL